MGMLYMFRRSLRNNSQYFGLAILRKKTINNIKQSTYLPSVRVNARRNNCGAAPNSLEVNHVFLLLLFPHEMNKPIPRGATVERKMEHSKKNKTKNTPSQRGFSKGMHFRCLIELHENALFLDVCTLNLWSHPTRLRARLPGHILR